MQNAAKCIRATAAKDEGSLKMRLQALLRWQFVRMMYLYV
jgi:hypothetical protein